MNIETPSTTMAITTCYMVGILFIVMTSHSAPITDHPARSNISHESLVELLTPPSISLTAEQIDEISRAESDIVLIRENPELLRSQTGYDIFDKPIVNITEEQMEELLPFYRSVFQKPSNSSSESPGRTTRSTALRICPASTLQVQPQLGINGNGNVVQIVQRNAMDINQVFFEEECEYAISPVTDDECREVTRLTSALVIDLETFMFDTQYIQIGGCAGFRVNQ